jgi:hypothetical protein
VLGYGIATPDDPSTEVLGYYQFVWRGSLSLNAFYNLKSAFLRLCRFMSTRLLP